MKTTFFLAIISLFAFFAASNALEAKARYQKAMELRQMQLLSKMESFDQ